MTLLLTRRTTSRHRAPAAAVRLTARETLNAIGNARVNVGVAALQSTGTMFATPTVQSGGTWLRGVAGDGAGNGTFAAWVGTTYTATYYSLTATRTAITAATTIVALNTALVNLGNAYGLTFTFWTTDPTGSDAYAAGSSLWTDADIARARLGATLFAAELVKYPPAFVNATAITAVNFVKDTLSYQGTANYAFAYAWNNEFWTTTPADLGTAASAQNFQRVFHHEYFHVIDGTWPGALDYTTWDASNPAGFVYGQPWAATVDGHPRGFIDAYATTNHSEDAAQIHSALMAQPRYESLKGWLVNDATLTTKVRLHHAFLGTYSTLGAGTYYDVVNGDPIVYDMGGTWNDDATAQVEQWSIAPGAEWGSWMGPIDVAFGAIYKAAGETWANAATGSYDTRWRNGLTKMNTFRTGKGTTYIRFAHEFSLSGSPWSVTATEATNFIKAWIRFRNLQKQIFAAGKLVWCPNVGASSGVDIRNAFPGAAYVDVYGVDSYNAYPAVNTVTGFNTQAGAVESNGAPRGIETHRQQASVYGLPLAICEWSTNGDPNDAGQGLDAPIWMDTYYKWLVANSGTGAGKVIYEVLFNDSSFGTGQYALYPTTKSPKAAATYRSSWKR